MCICTATTVPVLNRVGVGLGTMAGSDKLNVPTVDYLLCAPRCASHATLHNPRALPQGDNLKGHIPYNPNNEPIIVPYHLDLITGARSSTALAVAAFTLMLTIVMYALLNLIFG